ncbi:MAG: HNH endonuclease [Akkermansiaceae bacterium]
MRDLSSIMQGATLEPTLWAAMNDSATRSRLRQVLISRYFPQHRTSLLQQLPINLNLNQELAEYLTPARTAGFRKIVTQVYEHQCAACGLSLHRPDGSTIVDAAHIIPFSESYNDHPRNGLALCKNHHWAMDKSLIAPSPGLIWLASQDLDPRQPGEKELINLANQPIILPKDNAYHPLPDALEWRKSRLA